MENSFTPDRNQRKNYEDKKVKTLLAVPHYSDTLEDDPGNLDGTTDHIEWSLTNQLVTSHMAWRCELSKWQQSQASDPHANTVADTDSNEPHRTG